MRRLSAVGLFALFTSGCVVYARPAVAPMPEAQAVDIAYRVTRERGLNPSGTRYARYIGGRGVWRVSLWLGPPSCGAVRVNVDGFNGRAFDFVPFLRGCGGPPPVIQEDRMDM